jgi:hypothetical protein
VAWHKLSVVAGTLALSVMVGAPSCLCPYPRSSAFICGKKSLLAGLARTRVLPASQPVKNFQPQMNADERGWRACTVTGSEVSQWRFSRNQRASDRFACICVSTRFALIAAKPVPRSHRLAPDLVQEGRALPPGRGSTGSKRRPASGRFQALTIGRSWPGAVGLLSAGEG